MNADQMIRSIKVIEDEIVVQIANVTKGQGSEDYSDALFCIGTLWQWASMEMLWDTYKDDEVRSPVHAAVQNDMKQKLEQAQNEAKEALATLEPFGILVELDNLY